MSKISIIAGREFTERVRKKSFIFTTILMPIVFVGIMFVPMLMSNIQSETKEILVVDQSGFIAERLESNATIQFTPSESTVEEVAEEHPNVFGLLMIGSDVIANPSNVELLTYESSTVAIEAEIAGQISKVIESEKLKAYNIENIDSILADIETHVSLKVKQLDDKGVAKDSSSTLNTILAYIFGFLIYTIEIILHINEILSHALHIGIELLVITLENLNSLSHLGYKIKHLYNKLSLALFGIKIKSVCKALKICCIFSKSHIFLLLKLIL